MPRLLDVDDRVSTLTAAIEGLLGEGGVGAVSMRAIARESGVSTSSMHHHLDTRERMLRVCCDESVRVRLRSLTEAVIDTGPLALLPAPGDQDALWQTRVWQGWHELWRCTPSLGPVLLQARAAERRLVARALDHRLPLPEVARLHALVEGLRAAVCQPEEDLLPHEARACLATQLADACGVDPGRPLVDPAAWGWPYLPGPRAVATGS